MASAKVDLLIEGFADEAHLESRSHARYQPNIVLVQTEDCAIIVDPGTVTLQNEIATALDSVGLQVSDITHVVHTHHHLDHNRNAGMFPDVPVIDAWATWSGVDYAKGQVTLPRSIRVEATPGHTYDSLTLFVDTGTGITAICGDVFWWENDSQSDVYAEDMEALAKSRAKVLAAADVVIPGHGQPFMTRR
jgi:glyoxylase-like metal-dependent hydrolase (beta-lactamase superfamily II)